MNNFIDDLKAKYFYSEEFRGVGYVVDSGRFGRFKAGTKAGGRSPSGVDVVQCPDKKYRPVSQVVWALHYGEYPDFKIGHKNGDPADNRIENLFKSGSKQGRRVVVPGVDRFYELFSYHCDGYLVRKVAKHWNAGVGERAGCVKSDSGYVIVAVDGYSLREHRMIWEMHNGPIPDGIEIDHINGLRSDNRVENLRLANRSEQSQNTFIRLDNPSGVKGVTIRRDGAYVASIAIDGVSHWLGVFQTLEEAAAARISAENLLHPRRRV